MPKEIPLTKGYVALVDDEDYERVNQFKWHASIMSQSLVYVEHTSGTRGSYVHTRLHRFIANPPANMQVDHISGDGLDNRRCNLRICSKIENIRNQRLSRANTSGFKGVGWHRQRSRWVAKITHHQKHYSLGLYQDPVSAALAYDAKAIELWGEFSLTNAKMGLLPCH